MKADLKFMIPRFEVIPVVSSIRARGKLMDLFPCCFHPHFASDSSFGFNKKEDERKTDRKGVKEGIPERNGHLEDGVVGKRSLSAQNLVTHKLSKA